MEEISHVTASRKQLPASIKQGTPTYDELEDLGEKIEGKWKKLGRRLHIDDAKLQEIHQAHDQLSEKGYHMLRHWKQERGSAATYQALCVALQHKRVQRQDLAEQFCYVHGTIAIQLPTGPVPEEKETGKNPVATADACEIGASSKDQEESSKARSGLKRKRSKPNPERGNLSFKIRCASAISRNSEEQDPQQARKKVNRYMGDKVDEAKRKFDLSSFEGLTDLYAYLVGHLNLVNVGIVRSSLKITVKCLTSEILEELWKDYRSGHLNAVAEEFLITEKVKDELDMENIKLKTTFSEEDYLACKLSLMEIPVEASADDGQVELRGDVESREHEVLEELDEPTAFAEEELGLGHNDSARTFNDFFDVKHDIRYLQQSKKHYVASTYWNLGNVQYDLGDLQQARDSYERALDIRLIKLGPDHVDVAHTCNNLGIVHHDLGNLQQAKEYFKTALDILLKKLGPDHVDFATVYNNFGPVQHALGDLQQAKELYERALDIRLKKLGPDHVDVATTYNNVGILQRDLGDLQQAKDLYERALDIRLKKFGRTHVDVAATYNNLGIVQRDLGDLQQAKEHFERALDIRLINLGPDHVDVASTYNNVGTVQRDLCDPQRAEELFERALDILLKKLGPDHVDVARAYNNLAAVQHDLGDLQKAKEHFERALDILLKKLGSDHVDVARAYSNLAAVQHDLGDLPQAKENIERALDIRLKKLGPDHVDVSRTKDNLAAVQRDLGDLQQGKRPHRRAFDIRKKKLGPEDVDVARTKDKLAAVKHDLGDLRQAKKPQRRACRN